MQCGAVRASEGQTHLHNLLRLGVKGARGLVKYEDCRILDQRPGDSDALFLAATDGGATFSQHGGVALWEAVDELMSIGSLCCFVHLQKICVLHLKHHEHFQVTSISTEE